MARHDLGISKYARHLTGKERDFAVWCFRKIMGLRIDHSEGIREKRTAESVNLYLMRGDSFLPLSLPKDRHATLRTEYYIVVEKEASRPTYEQLELMFIEAEARRLHAEFAYRMLEERKIRSVTWEELSEEDRDGYLELAKEVLAR